MPARLDVLHRRRVDVQLRERFASFVAIRNLAGADAELVDLLGRRRGLIVLAFDFGLDLDCLDPEREASVLRHADRGQRVRVARRQVDERVEVDLVAVRNHVGRRIVGIRRIVICTCHRLRQPVRREGDAVVERRVDLQVVGLRARGARRLRRHRALVVCSHGQAVVAGSPRHPVAVGEVAGDWIRVQRTCFKRVEVLDSRLVARAGRVCADAERQRKERCNRLC